MNEVHYSSIKHDWITPQDFFDRYNKLYNFTWDLAADSNNAKCSQFYTINDDSLLQYWYKLTGWLWCNPPYGRELPKWVAKADMEAQKGAKIIMLMPSRTDTSYFHNHIYCKYNIEFIRGRLKFSGHKNSAPFPSIVVKFEKATSGKIKII